MKYKIIIRHSEEGYSVHVPGLPGCWSQGVSEEEAIENIKAAIQEYLEAMDDLFPGEEMREIDIAV
jgi:predicted RNase H-like HicB family nuclease